MPSIRSCVLAVAAGFAATAHADYVIEPDSVSMTLRTSWCENEKSTCPIICQQTPPGKTETNTCDPETLTYGCVCSGGLQPNISEYSLTLPYFVCQEWGNQCVKKCSDDKCRSSCQQDHPCGAQSPTRSNKTATTSTSATASATNSNEVFNGLDGASDGGSSGATQSAVGFVVLFASVCAGVAVML